MITTKGIVEGIVVDKKTKVVQYRVRLPLFHEVDGASPVTTNELPLAIYPLPPHMEGTTLRIGDVVECTLEDGGLDNVVILGMIPSSSTRNTAGSLQTESKVSMEKVSSLSFDEKGSAILPFNVKIRTDDTTSELVDGTDRNYVTGEELSYLRGLTVPLPQVIASLQEKIDYLENTLIKLRIKATTVEQGSGPNTVVPQPDPTPTPTPDPSSDPMSVPRTDAARLAYLFPNGVPKSDSEMAQYLTTIQVPIYHYDDHVLTTTSLTVHKKLVEPIKEAFQAMADIYFPVKPAGNRPTQPYTSYAYHWRKMGSGSQSFHSYGCAIDVNYYLPNSITTEVANIWKSRGWFWGGDWSDPWDPVHFCYMNH